MKTSIVKNIGIIGGLKREYILIMAEIKLGGSITVIYLSCLIILVFALPLASFEKISKWVTSQRIKIRSKRNKSELLRGADLLEFLSEDSQTMDIKNEEMAQSIPYYKFYTGLILELFHARRVFGAEIQNILFEIKSSLVEDLQFEKKVHSQLKNAWMQFIAMSALTWGFIFITSHITKFQASTFTQLLIIFLQIFGAVLNTIFYYKVKSSTLGQVEKFQSPLYGLKSLGDTGLAISVICEKAKVDELWKISDKGLVVLVKRLFHAIERLKKQGVSIDQSIDEIINEVRFIREQKFLKFLGFLAFFKFLTLALFYLSSYFIFIMSLFSNLLSQV